MTDKITMMKTIDYDIDSRWLESNEDFSPSLGTRKSGQRCELHITYCVKNIRYEMNSNSIILCNSK